MTQGRSHAPHLRPNTATQINIKTTTTLKKSCKNYCSPLSSNPYQLLLKGKEVGRRRTFTEPLFIQVRLIILASFMEPPSQLLYHLSAEKVNLGLPVSQGQLSTLRRAHSSPGGKAMVLVHVGQLGSDPRCLVRDSMQVCASAQVSLLCICLSLSLFRS